MDERDDEIREVMEEEKGRGRKEPHQFLSRRRLQRLLRILREMREKGGGEEVFIEMLRVEGIEEGSAEEKSALKALRAYLASR